MATAGTVTDGASAAEFATEVVAEVKKSGIACLTVGGLTESLIKLLDDRKAPAGVLAALAALTALCEAEPKLVEAVCLSTLPSQLKCFADRSDDVKEVRGSRGGGGVISRSFLMPC